MKSPETKLRNCGAAAPAIRYAGAAAPFSVDGHDEMNCRGRGSGPWQRSTVTIPGDPCLCMGCLCMAGTQSPSSNRASPYGLSRTSFSKGNVIGRRVRQEAKARAPRPTLKNNGVLCSGERHGAGPPSTRFSHQFFPTNPAGALVYSSTAKYNGPMGMHRRAHEASDGRSEKAGQKRAVRKERPEKAGQKREVRKHA